MITPVFTLFPFFPGLTNPCCLTVSLDEEKLYCVQSDTYTLELVERDIKKGYINLYNWITRNVYVYQTNNQHDEDIYFLLINLFGFQKSENHTHLYIMRKAILSSYHLNSRLITSLTSSSSHSSNQSPSSDYLTINSPS